VSGNGKGKARQVINASARSIQEDSEVILTFSNFQSPFWRVSMILLLVPRKILQNLQFLDSEFISCPTSVSTSPDHRLRACGIIVRSPIHAWI
jgi:hypothetical protein